jgi:hypothetical protein
MTGFVHRTAFGKNCRRAKVPRFVEQLAENCVGVFFGLAGQSQRVINSAHSSAGEVHPEE